MRPLTGRGYPWGRGIHGESRILGSQEGGGEGGTSFKGTGQGGQSEEDAAWGTTLASDLQRLPKGLPCPWDIPGRKECLVNGRLAKLAPSLGLQPLKSRVEFMVQKIIFS